MELYTAKRINVNLDNSTTLPVIDKNDQKDTKDLSKSLEKEAETQSTNEKKQPKSKYEATKKVIPGDIPVTFQKIVKDTSQSPISDTEMKLGKQERGVKASPKSKYGAIKKFIPEDPSSVKPKTKPSRLLRKTFKKV
uniref:Uncharacterized protein n=1 Tax=viral metagenome TaxID=1070528 RepID=A0A6C0JDJ5_9ZZZZ